MVLIPFLKSLWGLNSLTIKEAVEVQKRKGQYVQVGFNRRFYSFIPQLREILASARVRSVVVEIPESSASKTKEDELLWVTNSTHVLDTVYHLFGKFSRVSFMKQSFNQTGVNDSFNGLFTVGNNTPMHLISNWNSPTNFGISIYLDDGRYIQLKPLEVMKVFEGFEIVEPSLERPIRLYNPKLIDEVYCVKNGEIGKPGFYNQTKIFSLCCQ